MSTLQATNIKNASSATTNLALDTAGNATVGNALIMGSGSFLRNRIINGDMRIAQRGTAAVTVSSSYPVDRFLVGNSTDGAFSAQQDTSAPAGFINSVRITTTTADASLTTTQNLNCRHFIEGVNVSDLAWGTADARTITLSFWVRSSLTGTFSGGLLNSASNRSYIYTYVISSANTWEYKTVTIAGDTSGTWLTDTGVGISVFFSLGAGPDRTGTAGSWTSNNAFSATGSVSVIGTLNATWAVTGVQLEAGSTATPFERRQYGHELALCQRYFEFGGAYTQAATSGGGVVGSTIQYKVTKRTSPTVALTAINGSSASTVTNFSASGLVNGIGYYCIPNGNGQATVDWTASAEL